MQVQQRRGWKVVAAACALALLPVTAAAQTGELRDGLDGIASERDRVEGEVGELRAREGDARERLAAVDAELTAAEERLETLREELAAAEQAFRVAEAAVEVARSTLVRVLEELASTEAELGVATEKLEARVVAAYKYGQVSFTEVFTGVRDFGDLVSSGTLVSHVLDGDRVMVAEVERLVALADDQRTEAQALQTAAEREAAAAEAAAIAIEEATSSQAEALATIEERREERERLFVELREDRSAAEGHLAGLAVESSQIEAQLAAIAREQAAEEARRQQEAEAAAAAEAERRREAEAAVERTAEEVSSEAADAGATGGDEEPVDEAPAPAPAPEEGVAGDGGSGASGGGDSSAAPPPSVEVFVRPAAGPLTSAFGPRWGRNHNGVDIGGSVGANVVAARDGTVVGLVVGCHPTSSWGCGGGFGNYVTIVHAGGLATIYAHLSSPTVYVGQQVAAGQAIGGIGNSGNSYGPHLHFEVREAGVPRNPCGNIAC